MSEEAYTGIPKRQVKYSEIIEFLERECYAAEATAKAFKNKSTEHRADILHATYNVMFALRFHWDDVKKYILPKQRDQRGDR